MESFVSGKFTPSARLGARATQYLMFGHTETFFQAQRATPAQALSQKVSYIKKQCASWGRWCRLPPWLFRRPRRKEFRFRACLGVEGVHCLDHALKTYLKIKPKDCTQYPSYCPLGCKSWLF